ncbi:MAG TPA: tRNA pseudouridine(38-40) synthase TruA [Gallionellaceae bacterium]|nr:tRNA pseudouridine(38-40) synthase TruA [Gallionellaceae bacterium]
MRIALGLEYDGSPYCGWQSQPDGSTVQDVLQLALSQIAGESIGVIAAGRTDTGVHALEQVIHFDTQTSRPLTAWVRGVNALLPSSVAVLWAHAVDDEFHARFSAQARSYRYQLFCRPVRSALQHGKVGWFHQPLDVDKMREAAQLLLGEHDFSAFRASACQAKSPVKTLSQMDIQQQGGLISMNLTANAFLHHMVRNIVGCLVYVGKGKHPPLWMREVLEGRERSQAAPTFAPDGLYLRRITYDPKWGLPQL